VAWLFIIWSNLMFLLHLTLMILRLGRRSQQPTLLRERLIEDVDANQPGAVGGTA
jgi:hypothetical protein